MTTPNNPLVEQVFLEYRERIFGYIAGKEVPYSDRDDVFGEVMLKITRQAPRYDSAKAGLSTWVYTITRSVVADYFRRLKPSHELSEFLADDSDVEEQIQYEDELSQLAKCLELLPDRERRIIILRMYREMEYSAIARDMSVSEANARKIYSRAIERLRSLMGDGE